MTTLLSVSKRVPMIYVIKYIIYQLLSFIFNSIEFFQEFIELLKCRTLFFHESIDYTLNYLNENKISLRKLPRHLALIVPDEEPFLEDLVRILFWCRVLSIKTISLFDMKGRIKINLSRISNKLKILEKVYSDKDVDNMKIVAFNCTDGQNAICMLTKSLCLLNDECETTTDLIDCQLRHILGIDNDPEMAIVFGPLMCVYGFLPWQIRLTEFFRIQTYKHLRVNKFLEVFKKFENCKQKFGK